MILKPEENLFHLNKNNSERPVDALAEKHQLLTDNLESRDASASKNANIVNCNQIVAKGL